MLSRFAKIKVSVKTFKSDDAGAVTVDWVVLSASIIVLSVFLVKTLIIPIDTVTDSIAEKLVPSSDP
jgi:hypothetical protein